MHLLLHGATYIPDDTWRLLTGRPCVQLREHENVSFGFICALNYTLNPWRAPPGSQETSMPWPPGEVENVEDTNKGSEDGWHRLWKFQWTQAQHLLPGCHLQKVWGNAQTGSS